MPLVPRGQNDMMGARIAAPVITERGGRGGTTDKGTRPGPAQAELLRRELYEPWDATGVQQAKLESAFVAYSSPERRLAICAAGGEDWRAGSGLILRFHHGRAPCIDICTCEPDTGAMVDILFIRPRKKVLQSSPAPLEPPHINALGKGSIQSYQVVDWWYARKKMAAESEAKQHMAAAGLLDFSAQPTHNWENLPSQADICSVALLASVAFQHRNNSPIPPRRS